MEPLEARIVNLAMLLKNRAMLARGGDIGVCQVIGRAMTSVDMAQQVDIDLSVSTPSEETRVSTSAAFWEAAKLVEKLLPDGEEAATVEILRVELECARREIAMWKLHVAQWQGRADELIGG